MAKIKWIIPNPCDQEIPWSNDRGNAADFNAPLLENGDGVCVAVAQFKGVSEAGQNEADDDIRIGRVKRFDNPDDLLGSLKQPW